MDSDIKEQIASKRSEDITLQDLSHINYHSIINFQTDQYYSEYDSFEYRSACIGIMVTAPCSPRLLRHILREAVNYDDVELCVHLLESDDFESWFKWNNNHRPRPEVSDNFQSPFLGKTVREVAKIVIKSNTVTEFSGRWFLIADERTIQDSTLLFVEIPCLDPRHLNVARILPHVANWEAHMLLNYEFGFKNMIDDVDENGIYCGIEDIIDDDWYARFKEAMTGDGIERPDQVSRVIMDIGDAMDEDPADYDEVDNGYYHESDPREVDVKDVDDDDDYERGYCGFEACCDMVYTNVGK